MAEMVGETGFQTEIPSPLTHEFPGFLQDCAALVTRFCVSVQRSDAYLGEKPLFRFEVAIMMKLMSVQAEGRWLRTPVDWWKAASPLSSGGRR